MPRPPRREKITVDPKLLAGLAVALGGAIAGWWWISGQSVRVPEQPSAPAERLDASILAEPRFQNLTLFRASVEASSLGRSNPFALLKPLATTTAPTAPGGAPAAPSGGVSVSCPDFAFELDAKEQETKAVVKGSDAGASLVARLGGGGRRSVVYLPRAGAQEIILAPEGWILPPIAYRRTDGETLVCWNRFLGASAPLCPAKGLPLLCRLVTADGVAQPEFVLADDRASFLVDIGLDADGRYQVSYFKSTSGNYLGDLFGSGFGSTLPAGDGFFSRTYDGRALGPAVLAPKEAATSTPRL